MRKTTLVRPSISKSDKNWYSEQELSVIKKAEFNKGVEHFKQTYFKEFSNNLSIVQAKASQFFFEAIEKYKVDFKQIRLKGCSASSFELIFVMDENQFLDEDIYKLVYTNGLTFIENNFTDFCVTFIYMPFSKNLNYSELLLDGFGFVFDPNRVPDA